MSLMRGGVALHARRAGSDYLPPLFTNHRRSPMPRKTKSIKLALPDEFIALCASDGVAPELVLRGFIADLCELMSWAAEPRTDRSEERRVGKEGRSRWAP